MTRRFSHILRSALVAVTVILVVPIRSHAQSESSGPADTSAAEGWIREGVERRRSGDDAGALELFHRAYDSAHSAIALAQMGLAEQALGQWLASEEHVRSALATDDTWIAHNRAEIERAYAVIATHVGTVQLLGGTPGASVSMNGEPVGTMPLNQPIRAVAGRATLEIRATGYYPVNRTVIINGGESTRESVELRRLTDSAPVTVQHGTSLSNTLAIVAGVATVAFLASGIASLAVRERVVSSYNANPTCPGINVTMQSSDCASQINTGRIAEPLEIVSFALAGGLAATTAILVWMGRGGSSTASPSTSAWNCGPLGDRVGVVCAIRY